jgi:hypothetical protein
MLTTRPADNDAPDLSGKVRAKTSFAGGVADVQADPFEVSTLPDEPGAGKEVVPVPPEAAGSGLAKVTTWLELIVIAVTLAVWKARLPVLSAVVTTAANGVVCALIVDAIFFLKLYKNLMNYK